VANSIITAEVKAMLVRGGPLVSMCDDYVRVAMLTSNPAIGMFLPQDQETIYNKFVLPIDMSASNELDSFMMKLPGLVNIVMDGITINGRNKVCNSIYLCYVFDIILSSFAMTLKLICPIVNLTSFLFQIFFTISKGQFSKFHTWSDLGNFKHQMPAEIKEANRVFAEVMTLHKTGVCNVPVDNAARGMAAKVCASFPNMTILVTCNPSHCLDLYSKDMASRPLVKVVVGDSQEVTNFVKIDSIEVIKLQAVRTGSLAKSVTPVSMVLTRM